MKNFLGAVLGIVVYMILYSCASPAPESKEAAKPNVIVILADDMGYSDLSCFGSEIRTPVLDSLAGAGTTLTGFYNAGRCCPTRASLLTGLYPHQAGIGSMVADWGHPAYRGFLTENTVTIAEMLQSAGYATYMSGKWHVGDDSIHHPGARGFEKHFAFINGASSYYNLNPYRPSQLKPGSELKIIKNGAAYTPGNNFYMTDAITEEAINMIGTHATEQPGKPFMLYLAYTAPHWPLHAPDSLIEKYKNVYTSGWKEIRENRMKRMLAAGILPEGTPLSPPAPAEKIPDYDTLSAEEKDLYNRRMAVYAAMLSRMDEGIGRVMTQLRKAGMDKNTIIMFMSDNGACHEEVARWSADNIVHENTGPVGAANSFQSYEYPWANVSNTPFRLFKHWMHEGGISTPFIAAGPGIPAGRVMQGRGHVMDIMSTLADYAGAEYPGKVGNRSITPTSGRSMRPVLEGRANATHDTLYWEHENSKAMIAGDYKIVSGVWPEDGQWRLYNIAQDRTEMNPLSDSLLLNGMINRYQQWADEVGVLNPEQLKILWKK